MFLSTGGRSLGIGSQLPWERVSRLLPDTSPLDCVLALSLPHLGPMEIDCDGSQVNADSLSSPQRNRGARPVSISASEKHEDLLSQMFSRT